MVFIGIVGQIAAGKGEVVKILTQEYGFTSFNLSSILHTILQKKGVSSFTRTDLQDLGDRLRKEEGEGVLAKRAVCHLMEVSNSLPTKNNMVIEGIRNPAEVQYLRSLQNFTLLGVKAKKTTRYDRLRRRAKPWDPQSWKEFLVVDQRDKGIGQKKYGQHVGECVEMAEILIANNGSLLQLKDKVERIIHTVMKKKTKK